MERKAAAAAALPDDVLAEILRRLAPLGLAASRRVCRAWRDAVDARLRGHLLSRSVRGIFINYSGHGFSEFLSRPSRGPVICGGLDFLPSVGVKVADHCNGLLLCSDKERDYVVNPATRRWARLPRRPPPHMPGFDQSAYLAFEPTAPHYEVFLIPRLPSLGQSDEDNDGDDALLESEWPPASYVMHVFSSMDDRWEEKTFLREGEAAGIVAGMDSDLWYRHGVYWGSNLYIHCQHGYLMRMSLSNHTYKVIRLPGADELRGNPTYHLGRSLRGVYCANDRWNRLQLWHLDESRDQTEWVLKHDIDFENIAHKFHAFTCHKMYGYGNDQQMRGPWIAQNVNYRKKIEDEEYDPFGDWKQRHRAPPVEEKYDWNSDEDDVINIEDVDDWGYGGNYHFLGFNPYKEIVYLEFSMERGVAYDWNGSKFQDLGSLDPDSHYYGEHEMHAAFPYTPCWMGEFPGNELVTLLEEEEIARRKLEDLEDHSNFTCLEEYELRKFHGRAKRVKDSNAKIRRRRRMAAR